MHIDSHVHCRDWDESVKSTIQEVMQLARRQGVGAIFDMPNTRPPITTPELVERRLRTAREEGCIDGYYLYMGVTGDPMQVKEVAEVVRTNPKVIGAKMFAGKSVGDLAVIEEREQRMVYRTLAREHYNGVLAVHCELESLARPDLWIPEQPATWNLARPPEMEIGSVMNQIEFAVSEGFTGHLHICHASTPQTVVLVNDARARLRISCGATPHHLLRSTDDMQTVEGMRYKVNPPLRERWMMLRLMELLKRGMIDWIETDHAPHRIEEKTYSSDRPKDFFMSGIRSLEEYARLMQRLVEEGFTEDQVQRLTYSNIKKVFTKVAE